MALKKCKECGHEISDAAGKCPSCGAPQTKKSTYGCLIAVILLTLYISWVSTAPRTSSLPTDINTATDVQIYREFEICMNSAKEQMKNNKLKGRQTAVICVSRLEKYGDARAKKAMKIYFDMD